LKISKNGVVQFLLTVGYCIVYILCYLKFLYPIFEYAGFTLFNTSLFVLVWSTLIATFPIIFHKGYKAISSFITIFIFVLVYVPFIITFGIGYNAPILKIIWIQLVFMGCMILLFYADRFTIKPSVKFQISTNKDITNAIFKTVLVITIISTLFIIYMYKDNLRFVAFGEEVYELRAENMKFATGIITRYLSSWLSVVFIPICLVYGLMYRNRLFFILACISCLIIYMATASKGVILFPVIFLAFYLLFKKVSLKNIYSKFVFALTTGLLMLLYVPTFSHSVFMAKSIVMWRVVGNGGYLTMWYYDFFSTNPYTYYSHIGIVNAITGAYSYDAPLGFVIGRKWNPLMNANANFWATDGIAAMGILGVIVITLLFFFVLAFFNSATKNINTLFALLLMIPFIYSILNVSLFSSLLTGGGFFILLFFMILSSNINITQK